MSDHSNNYTKLELINPILKYSSKYDKLISIWNKLRGYILVLMGCFNMSCTFFLIKHLNNISNFNSIMINFYRGIFFTIYAFTYIIFSYEEVKDKFDINHIKSLFLRATLNAFGMNLVIYAMMLTRISTLELLLRTGNLFSVFLEYFLYNTTITKYQIFSIISTFIGIIFILKPSFIFGKGISDKNQDSLIGIIIGLFCAFIVAVALIFTKKLLDSFHLIYILLFMGSVSMITSFIMAIFMNISFDIINLNILMLMALAFLIEFTGNILLISALKYESLSKLAPFYNSRIIFSVLISFLIGGLIDIWDIIGITIVVGTYICVSIIQLS